jgi:polar amino acid transport system substrate-binding protein
MQKLISASTTDYSGKLIPRGHLLSSLVLIASLILTTIALSIGDARAQATIPVANPSPIGGREIVVGTRQVPPFALKSEDGSWTGLSIELWQKVAAELNLRYRFVEVPTVQDLLDGVAQGKFDAAIAAITVTADREKTVDFSQSFYVAGLGIATPLSRDAYWRPIVRSLTSFGFIQAVLALIVISLLVGLLIWVFERRHNDDFGGHPAKGLASSFWWSTIAMTQASTGDFGPRTLPGRILAIVWMIASIIALAIFTAGVTSVLTTAQLEGLVHGPDDLTSVRVGNVAMSSTEAYLDSTRIEHRSFPTLQEGLKALESRNLDAFVYDRPLMQWAVSQNFPGTLQVLDTSFANQNYAIAIPNGSPLRKQVDIVMLATLETDWWKQTSFRYLGEK